MKKITITCGNTAFEAEISEVGIGGILLDALPIETTLSTWGDEIYCSLPVSDDAVEFENMREQVAVGDIAWWPAGKAFCIFFGPTPASTGTAPVAASAVEVFGTIKAEPSLLRKVAGGQTLKIVAAGQ